MKKDTHPQYYKDAKITCACGTAYTIGAAKPEIKVEICAKCHPFYTGEEKLIDTAGRVERFKKRRAKGETVKEHVGRKKIKKVARATKKKK